MKRFLAAMLVFFTLFSMCGCAYRVKHESSAEEIYTCSPDNMFGLEKIVIFKDGIVLVFDKESSDRSDHVKFKDYEENDDMYGMPVQLHDIRHNKPHVRSSFEIKHGKYIASAFYYGDEDTTNIVINGMTLYQLVVDVNDGNILLKHEDWENVTDGYLVVTQRYDASSGEWGEIESDFISCWDEG